MLSKVQDSHSNYTLKCCQIPLLVLFFSAPNEDELTLLPIPFSLYWMRHGWWWDMEITGLYSSHTKIQRWYYLLPLSSDYPELSHWAIFSCWGCYESQPWFGAVVCSSNQISCVLLISAGSSPQLTSCIVFSYSVIQHAKKNWRGGE